MVSLVKILPLIKVQKIMELEKGEEIIYKEDQTFKSYTISIILINHNIQMFKAKNKVLNKALNHKTTFKFLTH